MQLNQTLSRVIVAVREKPRVLCSGVPSAAMPSSGALGCLLGIEDAFQQTCRHTVGVVRVVRIEFVS